jgi:hypothetical protein
VIWPITGYFGHFCQERYLFDNFLLIQNKKQPKYHKKKRLNPNLENGQTTVKAMKKSHFRGFYLKN